ncbi:oligopeptide transport ATP-binding protein AppF [Treponema primitia ZAS-2]|uniref:Oligopeptide transport ATP-binding protein AppF n=1 Tax=Treponema primitia (strain ATCC BAA-887 / DSM 12427 / ZAS-2) TaxID=545694 RepID=F5YK12_TREPZ|nr:oligopeptide/dipeptide ABC transporter ATP-binding protein [Treponema primitia]AEF84923.1 oligopeptide transport ATP-binding protein AppF [Treponema primitia ZAS-2]
MDNRNVVLQVDQLKTYFPIKGALGRVRNYVKAVDDVSFSLYKGETYGLVGETGCGKSTLGRTIVRLVEAIHGTVFFENQDILKLSSKQLFALRPKIQMVFQDPYSSLNPRKRVGDILAEVLDIHNIGAKNERLQIVLEVMSKVGLRSEQYFRYPNEFSGGQRQRIGLARALLLKPQLIICDEPVSALDVSIRSQIINLMQDMQEAEKLTYLFIAHDLSIVRYISNRIGVMYLGHIVEEALSEELFNNPLHPYTQALLAASPSMDVDQPHKRERLQGELPSPIDPPPGCPFHTRCIKASAACRDYTLKFQDMGREHKVACRLYGDS